jgi:NADPH:quinone reductase-like Zn-dependent oxidoreductase
MAVQVARRLGASQVIGAGRDAARLRASKADSLISLAGDAESVERAIASAAAEVDVVLDYLWGEPAERALVAIVKAREDRSRALEWIQIGSIAGPTMALPSVALRSANVRVLGSGQGSVRLADIVGELPALMKEIADGALGVETALVPLSQVEAAWSTPPPDGRRVVLLPQR